MQSEGPSFHSSLSNTTSNPPANYFGFTFKIYLNFYHFLPIHCLIASRSHIHLSSDLSMLTLLVSLLPPLKISMILNTYKIFSQQMLMKCPHYGMHYARQWAGHWHDFDSISAFKGFILWVHRSDTTCNIMWNLWRCYYVLREFRQRREDFWRYLQ